jgi:hypothetical protein
MAISHSSNIRDDLASAATSGTVDGGTLVLLSSSSAVLGTLGLSSPAFGPVIGGRATTNTISPDSTPVPGDIVRFEFRNSSGIAQISGTVGLSDLNDMKADKLVIGPDFKLSCAGWTYIASV